MLTDEEYNMMLKNASICTLGLALTMVLNPGITWAQSHCKGLAQAECNAGAACRWAPAREAGALGKSGKPYKTSAKAHCRLDVKAAGEIAAKALASSKR